MERLAQPALLYWRSKKSNYRTTHLGNFRKKLFVKQLIVFIWPSALNKAAKKNTLVKLGNYWSTGEPTIEAISQTRLPVKLLELTGTFLAQLKFTVLEQVKYNSEPYRREREKFFIKTNWIAFIGELTKRNKGRSGFILLSLLCSPT